MQRTGHYPPCAMGAVLLVSIMQLTIVSAGDWDGKYRTTTLPAWHPKVSSDDSTRQSALRLGEAGSSARKFSYMA